jgi:transglutaminase-like putative cysteine protease
MIGQAAVYYGLFCLQLVAVFAVTDTAAPAGLLQLAWWGALFAFSLHCGRQQAMHGKNFEQAGNSVALFGLLAFFVLLQTSGLVLALVNLTLWAQAAQNFTLAKRRGLYFTFGITFFLLLFAAANSKSGFFLFTLTAYVLAAIFTLYTNYLDQRNAAVTLRTEAVGKLPLMGPVLGLSFAVVAFAVAAYLIIPRPPALHYGAVAASGGHEYDNQEWEDEVENGDGSSQGEQAADDSAGEPATGDKPSGEESDNGRAAGEDRFRYSGFEQRFDIHAPGDGRLSNAIVLYLHADRPLYLKGEVFDTFDGRVWSRADSREEKRGLDQGKYTADLLEEGRGEPVFQEITLARDLTDTLFVAERLHRITFPARVLARDAYGGLRAPAHLKEGTVYSAESRIAYVDGRPSGGTIAPGDLSAYLQVSAAMTPRIGELAANVTQVETSPMAKALALETHLRTQYRYTFDTMLDNDNSISLERFLFETREGHCEFFATAMAMMLRTLDIPARLATGFSATNLNPLTGYYEVRGLDAHAWVEAYFPEHGWVLFEPTAFYDLPTPDSANDVSASIASYAERLAEMERTVDPDVSGTSWLMLWAAILKGIGHVWHLAVAALLAILSGLRAWLMNGGLLVIAPLILLGIGFYVARHALKLRWALWQLRLQKTDDAAKAVRRAYRAMESYFGGKGLARDPAWTVAEYRRKLQERFPEKAAAVAVIAEYYTRSRYGCEPLEASVVTEIVESVELLARR